MKKGYQQIFQSIMIMFNKNKIQKSNKIFSAIIIKIILIIKKYNSNNNVILIIKTRFKNFNFNNINNFSYQLYREITIIK